VPCVPPEELVLDDEPVPLLLPPTPPASKAGTAHPPGSSQQLAGTQVSPAFEQA